MTEKLKVDMPVIVEGKYDKIKLANIIDGIIITTDGFSFSKDSKKMALIRRYARSTGVIILTDSDGAGFLIRNMLKSRLGDVKAVNIYIPDVAGKEKRKDKPSKEGKLGVEGIDEDILRKAFVDAGVVRGADAPGAAADVPPKPVWMTKQRLIADGFSGSENSAQLRKQLCKKLGLPEHISANALIDALNMLYTSEEYEKLINSEPKSASVILDKRA